MKKILSLILAVMMSVMIAVPAMAYVIVDDEQSIGLIINEDWFDAIQPPILKEERTLAPLREIAEELEFYVDWEQSEMKITVSKGDISLDMFIDRNYIIKDGEKIEIDVAPTLWYDTTMIPLRLVAEALQCDVEWDGDRFLVFVNSPKSYEYYKNTPAVVNTYRQGGKTELTGYIEEYEYYNEAFSLTMPVKTVYHLVTDYKSNYVYDATGTGVMTTAKNVKRLEISLNDENIDMKKLIGKRVTVKGDIMPPAASWGTADVRIFADSVELNPIK